MNLEKMKKLEFLPKGDYSGYKVGQYTRPDKIFTNGDLAVFEVYSKYKYHGTISRNDAESQVPVFLSQKLGGTWGLIAYSITGTGNTTTLFFARTDKNQIMVPDNFKGIVIGKGGANIKAFCQKINKRVKLI